MRYATQDDLTEGVVISYVLSVWDRRMRAWSVPALHGSPLRITRPGKYPGDWMAVRLQPEPWEQDDHEWLIHHNQIAHRRYAVLPDPGDETSEQP